MFQYVLLAWGIASANWFKLPNCAVECPLNPQVSNTTAQRVVPAIYNWSCQHTNVAVLVVEWLHPSQLCASVNVRDKHSLLLAALDNAGKTTFADHLVEYTYQANKYTETHIQTHHTHTSQEKTQILWQINPTKREQILEKKQAKPSQQQPNYNCNNMDADCTKHTSLGQQMRLQRASFLRLSHSAGTAHPLTVKKLLLKPKLIDQRCNWGWSEREKRNRSENLENPQRNLINTKNYWKYKKRLCVRLRSEDKHHLRKSADRKAQIRRAFVPLTGLICAFRSADFLRWCLSSKRNLTHNLFFYFQ